MNDKKKKETESLAYRLLPNEKGHQLERDGAVVQWSLLAADGPSPGTLVLLHGVASNASRWEEFVATSGAHEQWNLLRLDLRGHASSVCGHTTRLEDWCADLAAILDAAGLDRAVIVGHSLGAQIAMNFAALYPERARAIVLLDPLVSEALTPKAHAMRKKLPVLRAAEVVTRAMNCLGFERRLIRQDLRAMDERAREKIARGGDELKEFIKEYSSARADLKYIHTAPYLRDLIEVGRRSPAPEMLRCPTLVVGSSAGTFTDSQLLAAWSKKLSHAKSENVQCKHWPMTECPKEVAKIILSWLETL